MGDDEVRVLSPRSKTENQWVPSCFGGFGCVETTMANDYTIDMKTTRSAPVLILKGLGTMTMGRLGETSNNLRDDIATWKQRIEDSLYIGVITYTTRSNLPDEIDHLNRDQMFVSRGDSKKPFVVVVDDIEEHSVYEVEDALTQENGASAGLLQLLSVLEVSSGGASHFQSSVCYLALALTLQSCLCRIVTFLEHSDLLMIFWLSIMRQSRRSKHRLSKIR